MTGWQIVGLALAVAVLTAFVTLGVMLSTGDVRP